MNTPEPGMFQLVRNLVSTQSTHSGSPGGSEATRPLMAGSASATREGERKGQTLAGGGKRHQLR